MPEQRVLGDYFYGGVFEIRYIRREPVSIQEVFIFPVEPEEVLHEVMRVPAFAAFGFAGRPYINADFHIFILAFFCYVVVNSGLALNYFPMSLARMQVTFLRLPKHAKMVGIGSLVLLVSTVLPWYADLDSYRIGDQFLGITGPASFVGIAILALSGFSLWIFSYHLFERHIPRLPVREGIMNLFVAIESLFLLVLVNSIYFHPKFGVNITLKESRFGMTLAFIGAIILLIGGYLQNREQMAKSDDVGKLEPLIKMEPPPRAAPSVPPSPEKRPHASLEPTARKILPHLKEGPHGHERGFFFGERRSQQPAGRSEATAPQPQEKKEAGGEGSYMIRLDL